MRAIVTGADQPLGAAAALGLRSSGWSVDVIKAAEANCVRISAAVTAAAEAFGGVDLVVISGWAASQLAPVPFEAIDDAAFAAMWEGGMQGMLWTLQAAIPHLRHSGGSVIVMMPTTGMTGGANFASAAATFEGQRILMKAAARQLGPQGIRVNAIAVGAELVLTDADAADVHYLAPPAIADEQAAVDVVEIITFLAGAAGRHLSGQTITIDGGRWLAP